MDPIVFPADLMTPVGVFLNLRECGRYPFLMESAIGGERFGRYSILGLDPDGELLAEQPGRAVLQGPSRNSTGSLIDLLRETCVQKKSLNSGLPFQGGWVGAIGFDWIHEIEQFNNNRKSDLPVAWLGHYSTFIVFDHFKQVVQVVDHSRDDPKNYWQDVLNTTPHLERTLIRRGIRKSSFTQGSFCKTVDQFKKHIVAGDIFQGVLSQRFSCDFEGDPFALYRALRRVNPSPYMFYHETPVGTFVGASPELQVQVSHDTVHIDPIAGTRPRGADQDADDRLALELKSDPKEIAEHMMLLDLARNDIGRVCDYGSVKTHEIAQIHKFSHVMHMVSNVRGRLGKKFTSVDALAATFPAGTVSGAPKIRALEIIMENEPVSRGFYSGAAGYIGDDGDLQFCITLRTAVIRNGELSYQAGAGIVADSIPELEFAETEHKAAAIERAIELLERQI